MYIKALFLWNANIFKSCCLQKLGGPFYKFSKVKKKNEM